MVILAGLCVQRFKIASAIEPEDRPVRPGATEITKVPVCEESKFAAPENAGALTSSSTGWAGPITASRLTSNGAANRVFWRRNTMCPLLR